MILTLDRLRRELRAEEVDADRPVNSAGRRVISSITSRLVSCGCMRELERLPGVIASVASDA
jgi:hypothetical protein